MHNTILQKFIDSRHQKTFLDRNAICNVVSFSKDKIDDELGSREFIGKLFGPTPATGVREKTGASPYPTIFM